MRTILKIIGIPILVYGLLLLISPFFGSDLGFAEQISTTIPLTLILYYEFLYARPRGKKF